MNIFFKFLAAATVATMTIPAIAADDSSNDYISSNPFETMIRLGRISEKSPIYQMPAGSASGGYISSATTSGDAVIYPLGYAKPNSPGSYFAIVSKETSLLIAGETFEFNATMTVDPSNYTLSTYTDWNRDGVFEKESRPAQVAASTKSFVQTIAIPENAELGKTRIRIRIESTTPSSADASISGRVYDFVVYVLEASDRTDRFISVSSNNDELGTAIIETPANDAGRYEIGTQVTVKAIINENSESAIEFKGWQEGNEIVSEESVYTFTVTKSTSLIAVFEAAVPDTNRKERYIAYDTNTGGEYSTALRVEKPANQTDKFLWRLEDAGNNRVYIVNKGTNLQISGSKVLEKEYFTASTLGSQFTIESSGHENGSYSIKYEGDNSYLLNAQDGTWGVVLYNAGIGTGSGWYFYRVPLKTPTGIENGDRSVAPKAHLYDGRLSITGLDGRNTIKAVSLSGQLLGNYFSADTVFEGELKYPERFIVLVIEPENGKTTTLKLLDSKL